MTDDNVYVPGVCNIGKEEIKRRRNSAIFGSVVAIAIALLLGVLHANKLFRLLVFFPLVSATIGFQQWYFKFCVRFGMKGLFNFKDLGHLETVEQTEMRKQDRSKAIRMIITGIVVAIILTIIFYIFD
jgi:predicted nucleic acid-binding Zn ribbon protein